MKYQELRKKYPRFVFEDYSYKISGDSLEIFFNFKIEHFNKLKNLLKGDMNRRFIEPEIRFLPKVIVENIDKSWLAKVGDRTLNNLVFQLGLMEILSYWKATCSPEIIIKPGFLNREQIRWWKELIINGMGQFFYENRIDWRSKNFFTIKVNETSSHLPPRFASQSSVSKNKNKYKSFNGKLKKRYLVPLAGGRDSIVTLESLKVRRSYRFFSRLVARQLDKRRKIALFLVNPNKQIKKVAKASGVKKQIIVKRIIDKRLLELNKKGFLNGHTPFTALLSFLSVFCAVLFDYRNIVFSNEKSAEEGNVKYLGKTINHQWAKSSKFEKMFKNYCKKYLAKNVNYFSFLRQYTELEISKMFIKYPQYFSSFSSCNASMRIGAKQIRWCGNCPKCLFVYLTLYPFLEKKELMKIFGKDFFENKKLLPVMKSLIGEGRKPKPFECVGTKKEARLAFNLSFKKAKKLGKVPYLLTKLHNRYKVH